MLRMGSDAGFGIVRQEFLNSSDVIVNLCILAIAAISHHPPVFTGGSGSQARGGFSAGFPTGGPSPLARLATLPEGKCNREVVSGQFLRVQFRLTKHWPRTIWKMKCRNRLETKISLSVWPKIRDSSVEVVCSCFFWDSYHGLWRWLRVGSRTKG